MPRLKDFIYKRIAPFVGYFLNCNCEPKDAVSFLQLLEVIIFSKPPQKSNILNWHQDVAYFPLKPNSQVAVWFPLKDVSVDMGPMVYALKSHKLGPMGSTDLHTNKPFEGETRDLIPCNPSDIGLEVKQYPMTQMDMLIHNGYTWHYSKPNKSLNRDRMGVSIRFLTEEVVFDPRPGQGAAFTKQITVTPGQKILSPCFPIVWNSDDKAAI
jgi:ectoine hydroxylase-related dioxygenase (phytanoyl-CoA dioxygenase family)